MMEFDELNDVIQALRSAIDTKRKDEAYLASKHWLGRVWRKLSVLKDDIRYGYGEELELTHQAKVVRIFLKNLPENEIEKYLKLFGLKDEQILALTKHYLQHKSLTISEFASIMKLSHSSMTNAAKETKVEIQNITLAVPSEQNQAFNTLLGKASNVYISTDTKKIAALVHALESPTWYENNLLHDADMLYVALAAVRENLITPQQYATLAGWYELIKHYGRDNIKIYPYLDENNQFTDEAKKYFLEQLVETPIATLDNHILLTNVQEEKFRQLISELPTSERFLMRLPIRVTKQGYAQDMDLDFQQTLGLGIFDGKDEYTLLSTGVYQTFIKAAFPDRAFQLEPRLGAIGIDDIEKGMRQFTRLLSVYYAHPSGFSSDNPRFFHALPRKGVVAITYHDMFHALLASFVPKEFYPLIFQSVDTIRNNLHLKWSQDLWHLIDFLSPSIVQYKNNNNDVLVKLLSDTYFSELSNNNNKFSPEVTTLMLDILFNPDHWTVHAITIAGLNTSSSVFNKDNDANFSYLPFLNANYFKKEDPLYFSLFKAAVIVEAINNGVLASSIDALLKIIENKKNDVIPQLSIKTMTSQNQNDLTQRNTRLAWCDQSIGETEDIFSSICSSLGVSNLEKKSSNQKKHYSD